MHSGSCAALDVIVAPLFGRDRRFTAVVAAKVKNRKSLGPPDDSGARHSATWTDDPGWTFCHELPLELLDAAGSGGIQTKSSPAFLKFPPRTPTESPPNQLSMTLA